MTDTVKLSWMSMWEYSDGYIDPDITTIISQTYLTCPVNNIMILPDNWGNVCIALAKQKTTKWIKKDEKLIWSLENGWIDSFALIIATSTRQESILF